jgi:5'(3')-deoxyribonucleotidase
MAVIAIDMDGTIADFASLSFKKVEELYGIKMTKADAYKPKTAELVWDRMSNEQRIKYKDKREIYGEVCSKGFFEEMSPFEGAVEAVKELAANGHQIIFLTKVLNWDRSAAEKAIWLKKYFSDVKYITMMVDSIQAKHIVNADIVIDDDVKVLEGIIGIPICMKQPWNEEHSNRFFCSVDNMKEAVVEIEKMIPTIEYWKD